MSLYRTIITYIVNGGCMKIGKNKLKMSSGEIRTFKSEKARDNFERVAEAVKHNPEFKAKLKRKK